MAIDYRCACVNVHCAEPSIFDRSAAAKGNRFSLSQASVAVCHQVTTLDRSKLSQLLGSLSKEILVEVEQGLKAALDLE